jgi:hypothetical protein
MSLGDPSADLPRLRQYRQESGRDPANLMVRGPLPAGDGGEAAWIAAAQRLQAAGVTHLNITAPLDLPPDQGLQRVIAARKAVAAALG